MLNIKKMAGASWMTSKGYPTTDDRAPSVSGKTFSTGGHYGVEIPVINTFDALTASLKAIEHHGIKVTRFNETHGSFLLSDRELSNMLSACREVSIGITVSLGPRPEYDYRASFYRTEFGKSQGRRLNSNHSIRVCTDEAVRLAELGCRGIIVYDLGVLSILSEMRAAGQLPSSMTFKASSHCQVTNQYTARMYVQAGIDSITTPHDLTVTMLGDIRSLNPTVCLDVPIDVYKTKGGYVRFHESSQVITSCSPVILKLGASAQDHPYDSIGSSTYAKRIERVARGLEVLSREMTGHEMVATSHPIAAIPVKPGTADKKEGRWL
ncbi:MAG TPA: U32 family peptidase [Gemmatimonadaceae bacterium]|nr:U32 family peptidase [Gemmatimonadaceae bacterium]